MIYMGCLPLKEEAAYDGSAAIDGLVRQDHLLRQIVQVIDFSFIYPLAKPYYSHTGQPSVDPVVIFKTLLVGYLYRHHFETAADA
jgi:transposase